jgi:hypothetical protein
MDGYGNQITKDTLRAILDHIPDNPMNAPARQAILDQLTQDVIDPTPYSYSISYRAAAGGNAIAVGAVAQVGIVNIQADSDFLVLNQTYDANTANGARNFTTLVVPNLRVLLQNTGSGYYLMSEPQPVNALFGFGFDYYELPVPLMLPAKASLQAQVTNDDAAAGYNLQLCFNGVKLRKYTQ